MLILIVSNDRQHGPTAEARIVIYYVPLFDFSRSLQSWWWHRVQLIPWSISSVLPHGFFTEVLCWHCWWCGTRDPMYRDRIKWVHTQIIIIIMTRNWMDYFFSRMLDTMLSKIQMCLRDTHLEEQKFLYGIFSQFSRILTFYNSFFL